MLKLLALGTVLIAQPAIPQQAGATQVADRDVAAILADLASSAATVRGATGVVVKVPVFLDVAASQKAFSASHEALATAIWR
jgi:hypothetical protein